MSSAFNPGYNIVLYINIKLSWNFESKNESCLKQNNLEIQTFYEIISLPPNKSVRNERIHNSSDTTKFEP